MKKRNFVIFGLMGVIASLIVSTSFSIAWYAAATRLLINSVEIIVDDDRDLKISTTIDGEYKSKLVQGEDDLKDVGLYKPVSSMFSSTWLDKKETIPEFRDVSIIEDSGESTKEWQNGFYTQELFIKGDDDLLITLDPINTFFKADVNKNEEFINNMEKAYPNKTKEEILERLANIINSIRVSILIPDSEYYSYAIIDPFKGDETLLGGILSTSFGSQFYYTYYKNGELYEKVFGEHNGVDKIVYNEPTGVNEYIDNPDNLSAFTAGHLGASYTYNEQLSYENGFRIKVEPSISFVELEGQEPAFSFPIFRNIPRKIVLSIYLEGWDKDNIDGTMGANFISNIVFKIVKEIV